MLTKNQVLFSVPVKTRGTTWGVAESMEQLPKTALEYLKCRERMFQIKIETVKEEEGEEEISSTDRLLTKYGSPYNLYDGSYRDLFNLIAVTNPYLGVEETVENFSAIQKFFLETENPQDKLEILDEEDLDGIWLGDLITGMYPHPEPWML